MHPTSRAYPPLFFILRLGFLYSCLPVFSSYLEVALWMIAYWAYLRSLLAYYDVATVAALPDGIALAREYDAIFDILEQLEVALLVMTLNLCYATHLGSNLWEAFFLSLLSHAVVHVCPLVVLALGSSTKIRDGVFYCTTSRSLNHILACSLSLSAVSSKSAAIC